MNSHYSGVIPHLFKNINHWDRIINRREKYGTINLWPTDTFKKERIEIEPS
jgi:hypothetical protein